MLRAEPIGFWSWDYKVTRDGEAVAALSLAWMSEKGTLEVGGASYDIAREGWASGAWRLSQDGLELVSARKPSALYRSFEVQVGDQAYILEARSTLSRAFVLRQGNKEIGSFESQGWLSRKMTVYLPESFSLAVQVFMAWLVIVLWKRSSGSS